MTRISNYSLNIQNSFNLLVTLITNNINPFERSFSLTDKSISNPFKNEMISFTVVFMTSFVMPLVLFFIFFRFNPRYKRIEMTYYSYFMAAHLFNAAVTCTLKVLVSRLRPDFLERCMYVNGVCTGDKDVVLNGRKSFPSGHTSVIFCGVSWMIASVKKIVRAKAVCLALQILLASFAIFVGWSRVYDYKHFLSDVIFGFVIGTATCVCFIYFMKRKLCSELNKNNSVKTERIREG